MNEFTTNSILMNSTNFLVLLVVFILIFHYLFVWRKNLSKKAWKKVDFFWLGAAALGLISLAVDVRVNVATKWLPIEKNYAEGMLSPVYYMTNNPEQSHFCRIFTKTSLSPDNIDEIDLQYQLACKWLKEVSLLIKQASKDELPRISFDKFPNVNFDDSALNEDVDYLKNWLEDYQRQLKIIDKTESAMAQSELEKFFFYIGPFLICVALALRITKVSGEIKYET